MTRAHIGGGIRNGFSLAELMIAMVLFANSPSNGVKGTHFRAMDISIGVGYQVSDVGYRCRLYRAGLQVFG